MAALNSCIFFQQSVNCQPFRMGSQDGIDDQLDFILHSLSHFGPNATRNRSSQKLSKRGIYTIKTEGNQSQDSLSQMLSTG